MARPRLPDWKKRVNKQISEHNKELAKEFNRQRLTKWTYHNGEARLVRGYYSRRRSKTPNYIYRWYPIKREKCIEADSQRSI